MSKRKKRRKSWARNNKHHLLYQRTFWGKSSYALALRNHFIYEMRIDRHNFIHDNLHDIPLPPEQELERMYNELPDCKAKDAREACLWLADVTFFEPFRISMIYQAELIREANKR